MNIAVVLLLLLPVQAGASLQFAGTLDLYKEVRPTGRGTTMVFEAPFTVEHERQAYFKVVPSPTNRAFDNGTSSSGWWTEATLLEGAQVIGSGASNGSTVVELAEVAPNRTYTLRLDVTIPPGALVAPGEITLRYVIALRTLEGTGSGGQMDPSLTVKPSIRVTDLAQLSVEGAASEGAVPPMVLAAGVAVLALVGTVVGIVTHRRHRR